jgi:hypothetical protein
MLYILSLLRFEQTFSEKGSKSCTIFLWVLILWNVKNKKKKKNLVASVLYFYHHAELHHSAFCPNGALVCSVQFSHHTVIFIPVNFHRLDFLMEAYSVLCEEHAETLFTAC